MEKNMKIFAWIPILNLVVIISFIVKSIRNNQIKKMIKTVICWVGIMIGFAIVRAVVTIILSQVSQFLIIDVLTYVTLYLSVTLGALLCLKQ